MNTDFLKIVSKSTLLTKEILFLFQMKKKSSNLLTDQNRYIKIYIFLLFCQFDSQFNWKRRILVERLFSHAAVNYIEKMYVQIC